MLTTDPDGLRDFDLDATRPLGAAFVLRGCHSFHTAFRFVRSLDYGRISEPSIIELVLAERRGTCSSKHALLAVLAMENDADLQLMLGIYLMDARNTPAVGRVLGRAGIAALPEAHCYLTLDGVRLDATGLSSSDEPVTRFLVEEPIQPWQTTGYKRERHMRFMQSWCEEVGIPLESAWRLREQCIAALSDDPISTR